MLHAGLRYYHVAAHTDLVQQVQYSEELGGFISCCKESTVSMYVGDLENKKFR